MKTFGIPLIVILIVATIFNSCRPCATCNETNANTDSANAANNSAPKTEADAYLDGNVIFWTSSIADLEKYLRRRVEPIEMPGKDAKTKLLVKYLSHNDIGFDELHIYESEAVKQKLYEEKIVAIVGNYFNLVQEHKNASRDTYSENIVNLMFLGIPVKSY